MKNIFFSLLFSSIAVSGFSQMMSGELKDEGRLLTSDTPYLVEGTMNGFIVYELTVDRTGTVTAARVEESQSTLKSTPSRIKTKKHVMGMKFTAGTYYPEFQTVFVKITAVKPAE